MAIRNIIEKEDPLLRKIARSVETVDNRIISLLDDMADTMYEANGVGLAAPQISVRKRLAVVDDGNGLIRLINPVIVEQKGTQRNYEGCLSAPGEGGYVDRPEEIVVEALDEQGEPIVYRCNGLLAIIMCHEIDHLDGILFIDKVLDLTEEELEALEKRDRERNAEVEETMETKEPV